MIVKHVPIRSIGESEFDGLVKYISDAQEKSERLGQVVTTNCQADTMPAVIGEVLATQRLNTRATGDKTYHLLVSFRAGEQPSANTLKAIEERICESLGYGEYQRVSAVHHDTDNLHIHIAINKIHPERHTMHEPFQSYRTLAELCALLEREYGLENDNHQLRRSIAEGRAGDMERHAGVDSLVGWIKRECLDEIRAAQSWNELHRVLHENGLALRQRANGFVIEADNGTTAKASTVARDLSKPKLEARLGPFEASPLQQQTKTKRHYQKHPRGFGVNTVALYAKYKAEQQTITAARAAESEKAKRHKDRRIASAKRSNRLRRASIKVIGESRLNKKLLYAQASKALWAEIQAINKAYRKARQALFESHKRRTWADWLKKEAMQGNAEALAALRAREAAQGLKGNTVRAEGQAGLGHAPVIDNITKKGTLIYRAGASAVRDDGDKLQVSREVTSEGLKAALRLARERYGNRIIVSGTTEFKAQIIRAAVESQYPITFADPTLEHRRQQLLIKESVNDRPREDRERAGHGIGHAGAGTDTDNNAARGATHDGRAGRESVGPSILSKPNVGRIGRVPPPQSQHRLRTLSQLGVVRLTGGSELLLPRDVSGHMEQQGAKSDHALRRAVFGSRVKPEQIAAADKYIAEREQKRLKRFDIQKHYRYTVEQGAFAFAGTRHVDGQILALLKRDDGVLVKPIDLATARRLTRVSVGDAVSVTAKGLVKTSKGRGR